MTSLTNKRGRVLLAWTAANALSLGTIVWLVRNTDPSSVWCGFFVYGGVVAIAAMQHLMLRLLGWPADWWWLVSCFGVVSGVVCGITAGFIVPLPKIVSFGVGAFVSGFVLGMVQTFPSSPSQWPYAWPAGSGLGFLAAAFFCVISPYELTRFESYILALAAGGAYGWMTGMVLVYRLDECETVSRGM